MHKKLNEYIFFYSTEDFHFVALFIDIEIFLIQILPLLINGDIYFFFFIIQPTNDFPRLHEQIIEINKLRIISS